MAFNLTIETDNAAFGDDRIEEVARILVELASRVRRGDHAGRIRDYNGNTVGEFEFTDDDEGGEA